MNGNIDDVISKKIDDIMNKNNIFNEGKVTRINSFILEITGLEDVFYFEKVLIGENQQNVGYVDRILSDKIVVDVIKTDGSIKIGDPVLATGEALKTAFSKSSMGLIIDPFGKDIINDKTFNSMIEIPIETPKIPIMDRTDVNRPLETGIAAIDLMYPIGRGQRQLIIGDKKTGKTQICLDTIVNQRDKNVICIYVAIGKTKKDLKSTYTQLVQKKANEYTIIVAVFNDDPVPLIKLTPYVAMTIAEQYMKEGKDVLVCIDDLKKHADACREIALIAEKNTARDAYPADIFYTHSRLLEKGCQHKNGGSITILPIVETKGGDITDYISTNIISITDGQIVLSEKLFQKGQKPAVNFGLSVSRLGGAVQKESVKKLGSNVRRELLSYLESADVYQLVNEESMSPELREKLAFGKKILGLLKQNKFTPMDEQTMVNNFSFILDQNKPKEPKPEVKKDDSIVIIEEPKEEKIEKLEVENPVKETKTEIKEEIKQEVKPIEFKTVVKPVEIKEEIKSVTKPIEVKEEKVEIKEEKPVEEKVFNTEMLSPKKIKDSLKEEKKEVDKEFKTEYMILPDNLKELAKQSQPVNNKINNVTKNIENSIQVKEEIKKTEYKPVKPEIKDVEINITGPKNKVRNASRKSNGLEDVADDDFDTEYIFVLPEEVARDQEIPEDKKKNLNNKE